MLDNKLLIGVEVEGDDLEKSLGGARAGFQGLGQAVDQLGGKLNSTLGGSALQSLTGLTQSLDRLSTLMAKIIGQSGQMGSSLAAALNQGGQIVDQYGRPISSGGSGGSAPGTPPGAGGSGGGGGDGGGPFDFLGDLYPGAGRLARRLTSTPGRAMMSGGALAVSGALDAASAVRRASVAGYQHDRYGESAALGGDPTAMMLDQANPYSRTEALGRGVRGGILSGGGALFAGGAALAATGIGVIPGLGMMAAGGIGMAASGISGYYASASEQREAAIARSARLQEAMKFRTGYGQAMGGAEQAYGIGGAAGMVGAGAEYGMSASMEFANRAAGMGVRNPNVMAQMTMDQRFRGRGLGDFIMGQTGRTMGGSDLDRLGGLQIGAGITSRNDPALSENLMNLGAEQMGASGMRFQNANQAMDYMSERVLPYAQAGREAGLSDVQTLQSTRAAGSMLRGMAGTKLGSFALTRALAQAGIVGPGADLVMQRKMRGASDQDIGSLLRQMNPNLSEEQVGGILGAERGAFKAMSEMTDTMTGVQGSFAQLVSGGDQVSAVGVQAAIEGRGPTATARRQPGRRGLDGEVEGAPSDRAQAVQTSEQMRQSAMQDSTRALAESITKSGDMFYQTVARAAEQFARGLGLEIGSLVRDSTESDKRIEEAFNNPGSGMTFGQ